MERALEYGFEGVISSLDTLAVGQLTRQEWFAGIALQGLLANGGSIMVAERAVKLANELIEQLDKELPHGN